jgi:hypothetical protein
MCTGPADHNTDINKGVEMSPTIKVVSVDRAAKIIFSGAARTPDAW